MKLLVNSSRVSWSALISLENSLVFLFILLLSLNLFFKYIFLSRLLSLKHTYSIRPYIWNLIGRTVLSASGLSGAEMCLNSMCPVWVWSWSELCVSAHTGSVLCKRRPLLDYYYWLFIKGRKVRLTQGQEASDWRQETVSLCLFIGFSLLRFFGLSGRWTQPGQHSGLQLSGRHCRSGGWTSLTKDSVEASMMLLS